MDGPSTPWATMELKQILEQVVECPKVWCRELNRILPNCRHWSPNSQYTHGDVADCVFRDRNFREINKGKLGHMGVITKNKVPRSADKGPMRTPQESMCLQAKRETVEQTTWSWVSKFPNSEKMHFKAPLVKFIIQDSRDGKALSSGGEGCDTRWGRKVRA